MRRFRAEYACAECGRPFGRRSSAKRHIAKLHLGKAKVVSFVDYLLGVWMGLYNWPTYNAIQRKPSQDVKLTANDPQTIFDQFEKLGKLIRNFDDISKMFRREKEEIRFVSVPTEYLVGYYCVRCYTRGIVPLSNLDSSLNLHTCNPQRLGELKVTSDIEKAISVLRQGFGSSLRQQVERWNPGQKYLQAFEIDATSGSDAAFPKYVKVIGYDELKKGPNECIVRAISRSTSSGSGLVSLTEQELVEFLDAMLATVALVKDVTLTDKSQAKSTYVVRVAPSYAVSKI
jgi:hypothetical protein